MRSLPTYGITGPQKTDQVRFKRNRTQPPKCQTCFSLVGFSTRGTCFRKMTKIWIARGQRQQQRICQNEVHKRKETSRTKTYNPSIIYSFAEKERQTAPDHCTAEFYFLTLCDSFRWPRNIHSKFDFSRTKCCSLSVHADSRRRIWMLPNRRVLVLSARTAEHTRMCTRRHRIPAENNHYSERCDIDVDVVTVLGHSGFRRIHCWYINLHFFIASVVLRVCVSVHIRSECTACSNELINRVQQILLASFDWNSLQFQMEECRGKKR